MWVHAEVDGHVWTCWPADVEADDCKENKNKDKITHPAGGEHKCVEGMWRWMTCIEQMTVKKTRSRKERKEKKTY